jgi:predicted nucleotidyltransferase
MSMIAEIAERRPILEALCRDLGVARLEVFGSATTGEFRGDSDLDFLVEFDADAIGSGYADRYFGFLEALEQVFDRPVDLVVISAITNPFFLESVQRTRALLYAA